MKTISYSKDFATILLAFFISTSYLHAQLDKVFEEVFSNILGTEHIEGALASVTPPNVPNPTPEQDHKNHFIPAYRAANSKLVPALNRLITSNISSFPLSSTSAGIQKFDLSGVRPEPVIGSLGPIFAETGRTLGKGKLHTGMNYNYLDFAEFRGIRTENIGFNFTHEDISPIDTFGSLGNSVQESDVINIVLNLDINASIFAFYATYGITDHLDVSVALPVVNISMSGNAKATIDSYTFARIGRALHHFDKSVQNAVAFDPVLEYTESYERGKMGIGDLALRLKYSFLNKPGGDLAALLDVRFPTGDSSNFFGTGYYNVRFAGIASRQFGGFTPHLNVAYDYRGADMDSDELEFIAGFDQQLLRGLTFAFDVLGEFDLNPDETLNFEYNETPIVIVDQILDEDDNVVGYNPRPIEQTNIPKRDNDNILSTAIGLRYAPVDNAILLGNILLPLNDGGLRSSIAYTIGFSMNF